MLLFSTLLVFIGSFSIISCNKSDKNPVISLISDKGIILPGISALAFSSDDSFFAAGTGEGSLMIWDITRSRRIRAIRAGDNAVTSVTFSPDGKYVAAGTSSGEITVWDFIKKETANAEAKLMATISTGGAVSSLAFNETGKEIISLSNKDLQRWNITTGKLIEKGGEHPKGFDIKYSQKNNILEIINKEEQIKISITEKVSALAVNNGSTRILTGSDTGIIHLWNLQTNEEIIRYISFGTADEKGEWISLLPSGYYNASKQGDALMEVKANGEIYSMAQFSNALFRPDMQAKAVKAGGEKVPEESLATILAPENIPPAIEIMGPKSLSINEGTAQVRVKITAGTGGIGRIKVTRGNSLIGYMALDGLIQKEYTERGKQVYEAAFTVPLEPGENKIGISVFGERRKRESKAAYINITSSWTENKEDKPILHVLLMSLQTYKNAGNSDIRNLRYTKADADALGRLFDRQKKGTLYRDIKIYKYTDEQITREGFQHIFTKISEQVGRNDNFVFFFAGHGFVDSQTGDFFFIPWDSVGFFDNPSEQNILMDDIVGGITSVHAKNSLILLDTCQSGTLLESGDTAFEKLIRQLNQKAIITATMGRQDAIESARIGHGIFTASILDSYEHRLENQYSAVSDLIAFTGTDVPAKFAKIMKEAAARGMNIEVIPQTQKPMASMSQQDFTVFDRYTELGIVEIRSITQGTISIFGLPKETTKIIANGTVEKRLAAGTYNISVEYENKHMETKEVTVRNMPQSRPRKEVVKFEYKIPVNVQAKKHYDRGSQYYDKNDFDSAIIELSEAIKIDPNYIYAYWLRGNAYIDKKKYDLSIKDYNDAIRLDPKNSTVYVNRGLAYYLKGDYDRAIVDMNEGIRLSPNAGWQYTLRGNLYRDKGDSVRAIVDYKEAIRLTTNPKTVTDYINRGVAYEGIGDNNRAIADYETALRISPNNPLAKSNLENLRKKMGTQNTPSIQGRQSTLY